MQQDKLSDEEINNRFGFHKATIEGPNATKPWHADLRHSFTAFANYLNQLPGGRYKSLMWTALEEASMWAHKSTASLAPLSDPGDENESPADVQKAVDEMRRILTSFGISNFDAQEMIVQAQNAGALPRPKL